MPRIEEFFKRALKLHHLRLLVMLGQWGQMRVVAQKLGVSPPAVSRQLAELEAGLGLDVVRRVGNGLVFTDAGLALLERARTVIFQLEQAQQELTSLSSGLRGEISIGAVPSVMQQLGAPLTLALRERIPAVSLNLQEETSDRLYTQLCNGNLHLLFCREVSPQFSEGSISGEVLFDDPLIIVCPRSHKLYGKHGLTTQDLYGQAWVLPDTTSPAFQALNTWMHRHRLEFAEGSVRAPSASMYRTLLTDANLLGLMSLSTALRAQHENRVMIIDLPGAQFLPSVWMFHNEAELTSTSRIAIECVRQLIKERQQSSTRS